MRAGLAVLGLLFAFGNACAEENPPGVDWLKTVAFAGHQTDYSGVFIYQYDDRVETSRITHVIEPDGEYERLEYMDGPKREIIRHHGHIWEYANHRMVHVGQQGKGRFPSLLPEQMSALNANYKASQIGSERIAGYDAQVILLKPRDNLRYSHKLWVHRGSGLLLKLAVLDEKAQPIEQYVFTQLQIGGNIDRAWVKSAPSAATAGPAAHAGMGSGVPVNSGWVVDTLPEGFKKTMEIERPRRGKHAPVTQLVYSDGLSAISVFIEPNDKDEDDNAGLSSRGAMNLYHRVADGHLFTVVGEVPGRTVLQVIDSLRFNGTK